MLRDGILRSFITQCLGYVLSGKQILNIVIDDPYLSEFLIFGDLQCPVLVVILHVILLPFLHIRKGNVLRFL